MASGSASKFNIALQQIIDDIVLCENKSSDADIEAIEEENAQLYQKKIDLMAKWDQRLTVNKSIVSVKDMLSRLKSFNQSRFELKELVEMRNKERLREVSELTASSKHKIQEVDHLMELPYNEVQEKLSEMEKKIIANRTKINDLTRQHAELSKYYHEESENVLNLMVLKSIEEEQTKLLENLK